MSLIAYNKTGSPLALAAGNPAPTLPASSSPPSRGPGFNVTSELRGLTAPQYAAIQAQVTAGDIELEWTGDPEYTTTGLTEGGPSPGPHASTHAAGGGDLLTVAGTTATNQTASTGVTVNNATATNNSASTGATVDQTLQAFHETFLAPAAPGTSLGTIQESAATGSLTTQPGHPRLLYVAFDAGWGGGDITITGKRPDGTAVSDTFVANPGNTVRGVKVFATVDAGGIANSAPGGTTDVATVKLGNEIGVAQRDLNAFVMESKGGVAETLAASSTTEGHFSPGSAADGTANFEVWYSKYNTHTVTDPGHNHTQNAHNHGVTDPAHNHTQNSHTHALSS